MMEMSPVQYAELLNSVRAQLAEVNTTLPAAIVDYDPVSRLANVRPSIDKLTADGRVIEAPLIYNVEVRFLSSKSANAIVSLPLAAGDGGMLHFSQRSLDEWLEGSRVPSDSRNFDLNDAFFVPGVDSTADVVPAEPDCLLIKIGAAVIRMYGDGHAVVTLPAGFRVESPLSTFTGDVQVDGGIHSDGDTVADKTSLKSHDHFGGTEPDGTTGVPTL